LSITLALAGDAMLGRSVAERIADSRPLFAPEIAEILGRADLCLVNLECCISDRGSPWPAPGKPFFFRAPPEAAEALAALGVDCVSLANNHALDFSEHALLDTLEHLDRVGISWVGAGIDVQRAREPAVLSAGGFRVRVIGLTDHPEDYAADVDRPGVAFADLRHQVPAWLLEAIRSAAAETDAVLVFPHWGPNMTPVPVPHVLRSAPALLEAGASLVAGHSAHVFQGVQGRVLFDLGGFIDDYAVDPVLRNDLGLIWLITLDADGPIRLEAAPLSLDFCFTRLADGEDAAWIRKRFRDSCAAMGTDVTEESGRLVVTFR
jgi:poly-gamma-glutamate capsule biosynthesis protein CapA/YwtB (metallophosphatase superfamily)